MSLEPGKVSTAPLEEVLVTAEQAFGLLRTRRQRGHAEVRDLAGTGIYTGAL